MGIITFAFGMGGPVANFAALLHMTVHSLTKSAIFFTAGTRRRRRVRNRWTAFGADRHQPNHRLGT